MTRADVARALDQPSAHHDDEDEQKTPVAELDGHTSSDPPTPAAAGLTYVEPSSDDSPRSIEAAESAIGDDGVASEAPIQLLPMEAMRGDLSHDEFARELRLEAATQRLDALEHQLSLVQANSTTHALDLAKVRRQGEECVLGLETVRRQGALCQSGLDEVRSDFGRLEKTLAANAAAAEAAREATAASFHQLTALLHDFKRQGDHVEPAVMTGTKSDVVVETPRPESTTASPLSAGRASPYLNSALNAIMIEDRFYQSTPKIMLEESSLEACKLFLRRMTFSDDVQLSRGQLLHHTGPLFHRQLRALLADKAYSTENGLKMLLRVMDKIGVANPEGMRREIEGYVFTTRSGGRGKAVTHAAHHVPANFLRLQLDIVIYCSLPNHASLNPRTIAQSFIATNTTPFGRTMAGQTMQFIPHLPSDQGLQNADDIIASLEVLMRLLGDGERAFVAGQTSQTGQTRKSALVSAMSAMENDDVDDDATLVTAIAALMDQRRGRQGHCSICGCLGHHTFHCGRRTHRGTNVCWICGEAHRSEACDRRKRGPVGDPKASCGDIHCRYHRGPDGAGNGQPSPTP